MRTVITAISLLLVMLLVPLGLMSSERALLFVSHWAVNTFTDLRLELSRPVIKPFSGLASASEIHLYPKTGAGPPFLSVLNFKGDVNVMDIYRGTLAESKLAASQVTIYISSNDSSKPSPVKSLKHLRWLPEELEIGRLHFITAAEETLIFPLQYIVGKRLDRTRFLATATAEYEGEPLAVQVDIAAAFEEQQSAGLILTAAFTAPESGSSVVLQGELQGTVDEFNYDFSLDADYHDVSQFMRGFNTPRPLEGNLTVRARMRGDTQGFVLSDALFVLDNMPEYGIEAHGHMKYDLGGSKEIQLTASGELTSLEAALGWLSIDLSPFGGAMGSATISGTLENPLVEQFILRSENDQGLTVNIQGRLDPQLSSAIQNKVTIDIFGPTLTALSPWTGKLPHDPGAFSASGVLVGSFAALRLENFVAEVGTAETALLRITGDASISNAPSSVGFSKIENSRLKLSLFTSDSKHLSDYNLAGVPEGFEVDGQVLLRGNGDELNITGGIITAKSSDINATLEPHAGVIRLQEQVPLSLLKGKVSVQLSDTSALSQYVAFPVPVLGEVNSRAVLVQQDARIGLDDILLTLSDDGAELRASGSIFDLGEFRGVRLRNTFSGIDTKALFLTVLQDLTYEGDLGQLEGSFEISKPTESWNLSKLNIHSAQTDGPFETSLLGHVEDITGLPSADLTLDYKLRDPSFLRAITGLDMSPSSGVLQLQSNKGKISARASTRFGETQLSAVAAIVLNADTVQSLSLQLDSPVVQLQDIGLQATTKQEKKYKPLDQLNEIGPAVRLQNALQNTPNYDTDIMLNFGGIEGNNINIESFVLHFTGNERRYTLRQLSAAYDQSNTEIRGIIDLNTSPPYVSLAGEALAIPVELISKDLGINFDISGIANLRGGITSQGSSYQRLLETLNGNLAVSLKNAVVEGAAYDILATDLLAWFYSGAALEDSTKIDCTMALFLLNDGVASTDSLYIETSKMVATGSALLNLADESLDVRFTPRSKTRKLQVPSSIRVKGNFEKPKVTISPVAAAADAYAEILSLLPQLVRRIFGSDRRKRIERPCDPTPA